MLRILLFLLLITASTLYCTTSYAVDAIAQTVSPAQLNAVMAQFVAKHQQQVPGGVISWVQDQQAPVTVAFGLADLEQAIPVTADTTQFRIASVSKIFTAIAVAKLVEQGQLELNAPITRYLPDAITGQLQWPVTTLQLLTHTAGFEDQFFADSSNTEQKQQSLRAHLQHALPKQIYEPSTIIAYSNYGNALAALVVEFIANQPFDQYVQQHILAPLNMTHTGYNLTELQRYAMAIGYQQDNGSFTAQPYTFVHRYPATSMLTTAVDMQKLIRALLLNNDVITPFMQALLFSRKFAHHPRLPAMGLAFMEYKRSGLQAWWHDGSHAGFNAELVIIPQLKAGFFTAVNSSSGELLASFRRQIFAELLTLPQEVTVNPVAYQDLNKYAGQYRNSRMNQTRFESIQNLFSRDIQVDAADDHLVMGGNQYYPVAEHVFQEKSVGHVLVFGEQLSQSAGQISTLMLDWGGAPRALVKLSGWQTSRTQLLVLAVLQLLAVLVIVIFFRSKRQHVQPKLRLAFAMPLLLMTTFVVLLVGYFFTLDPLQIRFGNISGLQLIMLVPLVAVLWQSVVVKRWCNKVKPGYHISSLLTVLLLVLFFSQYHLFGVWL